MNQGGHLHRRLVQTLGSVVLAGIAILPAACVTSDPNGKPVTLQGGTTPPANPNQTFQNLTQAAQRGEVDAQLRLGNVYFNRQDGTPAQNYIEAAKWYRLAARQGNATAQNNLGHLYDFGLGVTQNKAEAVKLYRQAADQGHALGEYNLGRMYLNGEGIPQDYAEARRLFVLAADKNNAAAQNALGTMYAKGQSVAADPLKATKWYRRAADAGNATAQSNLASHYVTGLGVPQDDLLAYFWYNVASARLTAAQRTTAANNRDAVAKKLSAAEIERVQAVARDWKPGQPVEAELRRDPPNATSTVASASGAAGAQNTRLRSTGTGFVISKSGHVLTNAHVVESCTEVRARLPGEPETAGSIVAKDASNDLAVLKLRTAPARVLAFRSDQGLRQGDSVVVYGYPLAGVVATDGALTTGNISALSGIANDSRMLQITAPVQPGNSGGPLVDASGNVVGVVVAKLNAVAIARITGDIPQNVNFAIKSGVARSFLEANGIEYQTAASTQSLGVSDVGERVKKATVKIECWR